MYVCSIHSHSLHEDDDIFFIIIIIILFSSRVCLSLVTLAVIIFLSWSQISSSFFPIKKIYAEEYSWKCILQRYERLSICVYTYNMHSQAQLMLCVYYYPQIQFLRFFFSILKRNKVHRTVILAFYRVYRKNTFKHRDIHIF